MRKIYGRLWAYLQSFPIWLSSERCSGLFVQAPPSFNTKNSHSWVCRIRFQGNTSKSDSSSLSLYKLPNLIGIYQIPHFQRNRPFHVCCERCIQTCFFFFPVWNSENWGISIVQPLEWEIPLHFSSQSFMRKGFGDFKLVMEVPFDRWMVVLGKIRI